MTVSRWRDEGAVGKVRLGSTTMRGFEPRDERPMDGCHKELQMCSEVGVRGCNSKRTRVA